MAPIVLALGSAAAGAFLYNRWKRSQAAAAEESAAQARVASTMVSELAQGKTYVIQANITSAIGTRDVATASSVIKATMEQLGWKVLSPPMLRNDAATTAFTTGQTSEWVFNGQWTKADKFMAVVPAWWGNAAIFLLPVA